jgi:hypothetical protein
LRPRARDAENDGVAARTAHDRAHAVRVDEQRTERPDRSAIGARCARGCKVWDEDLAQDPSRGIPVEPRCVANTLVD